MKTSLVIMAAGLGSRFKGGLKQLEPIDENNHIIMDYSIYDAIQAGFNKIILIIRKDIEQEFREIIGNRLEKVCRDKEIELQYAFQSVTDIPIELPEGRTKPWGTGHAVLSAKDLIDTPFAVINADDYYGKNSFKAVHDYLINENGCCMVSFSLENTLSDNGGVTRGICRTDEQNNLTEIVETRNIVKNGNITEANGKIINPDLPVSMNMWGFTPDILDKLEKGFEEFLSTKVKDDCLKAEYLIPDFVSDLLKGKEINVKVLKSDDVWYGITYKEDTPYIKQCFRNMTAEGKYKEDLFRDL